MSPLSSLLLGSLSMAPDSAASAETGRVDTIIFLPHGAFEGSQAHSRGETLSFRTLEWLRDNVLHNRTRPTALERRLLFAPGDTLDSLRLRESERLLRDELFLADADIRDSLAPDGRRVRTVETWDQWSTNIPLGLNRSGGELSWWAGFSESNLLGTGRELGGSYWHTPLRRSTLVSYTDNAVFAQGNVLQTSWTSSSDGHTFAFLGGHPLRDQVQRGAWSLEIQDQEYDKLGFLGGAAAERLRDDHPAQDDNDWSRDDGLAFVYPGSRWQWVRLSGTAVWGREYQAQTSLLAESEFDSTGRTALSSQIPTSLASELRDDPAWSAWRSPGGDRDDRRVGVRLAVRHEEFAKRRNFNNLKWSEDIPVGWFLEGTALANVISRGTLRDGWVLSGKARWSALGEATYAALSGTVRGYAGSHGTDADRGLYVWKAEARRLHGLGLQTLVTGSGEGLFGLAPGRGQVLLGEESGLPGYTARSFQGMSKALFSAESRWTPPFEALTVAPALAVFAGAGRAGDETRLTGSGPWKAGAGVGLRFGLTRSLRGIVNHLSIARPLGRDGGDWNDLSGWLVSFGAKQSL